MIYGGRSPDTIISGYVDFIVTTAEAAHAPARIDVAAGQRAVQ